ncbi:MAG: ATP-binding protein, partial [Bacteroidetes bacterium]
QTQKKQNKTDEDVKHFLMISMLHSLEKLTYPSNDFFQRWELLKPLLLTDYFLHEYTIYNWTFGERQSEEIYFLVPYMRALPKKQISISDYENQMPSVLSRSFGQRNNLKYEENIHENAQNNIQEVSLYYEFAKGYTTFYHAYQIILYRFEDKIQGCLELFEPQYPQNNNQKQDKIHRQYFECDINIWDDIQTEITNNNFSSIINYYYERHEGNVVIKLYNTEGHKFHKINWNVAMDTNNQEALEEFKIRTLIAQSLPENIEQFAQKIYYKNLKEEKEMSSLQKIFMNSSDWDSEFKWLREVIETRFDFHLGISTKWRSIYEITPPDNSKSGSFLSRVVNYYKFGFEERIILALAMAVHLKPQLLDAFFQRNEKIDRTFSEVGGWKGRYHSGFLPTLETASFLLAGADISKRIQLLSLFDENSVFKKENIIRLNIKEETEPIYAGALVISEEYFTYFTTEKGFTPTFSNEFPAEWLTTHLEWEDLFLEEEAKNEIKNIQTWVQQQNHILYDMNLRKHIKNGYKALFYGGSGTGKSLTATLLGKVLNMRVYRVDMSKLSSKYIGETSKNLARLFDTAENKNWILFFDEAEALFGKRIQNPEKSSDAHYNEEVGYILQRIENYNGLVVLATNLLQNIDTAFLRRFQSLVHFAMPSPAQQLALWKNIFHQDLPLAKNVDFEFLSKKYVLTASNISNLLRDAVIQSLQTTKKQITMKIIKEATEKELNKTTLTEAELLTTNLEWKDLFLEEETQNEIKNIQTWLKNKDYILDNLNLRKHIKNGYRALFYGTSGTGKTITATLLGQNLDMDVYRVDLSRITSKYIGETTKNLAKLFDVAENKNWILFFDEAESLFGRRTQNVERATDSYYNQEVGYLLQRIENYNGLVILATNLLDNVDTAFLRRFQSLVHFPIPSPTQQLALWQNIFHQDLPLGKDIDFKFLSEKYVLTASNISNILRDAVIQSLQTTKKRITMQILKEAIERELKKANLREKVGFSRK